MTRVEPSPVPTNRRPGGPFSFGTPPPRRGRVVVFGVLTGFLLTVLWSAPFVDSVIGDNVANTLLGHDAKETAITGTLAGIAFAFVSGLAGTFTACNIAVFGTMAPLVGEAEGRWRRALVTLRPLLWLAVGMIVVAAAYGVVVALVGTGMPQFDTTPNVPGQLSPRSIQSMVVFGLVGLAMVHLGLAALGIVRDPFARLSTRFPNAPLVVFGALVGAFLIGRPFPLFRMLFRDAAESGNPLYGAGVFVLQSVGNIIVLALLVVLVNVVAGGALRRWLLARPHRLAVVTGGTLLAAGAFTFLYWDVRLLAMREILPWYPLAPWV